MFEIKQIIDNKYEIEEQIGTGGGGIVYKAYQRDLGRTVAIKQIKDDVKGVIKDNFEADILKNLKSDYIPTVYALIREDGQVYTVMEYVDGKSLQECLDNRMTFSQKEIINYSKQLCEAVKYLHTRRIPIIHSDIKPANIMLTSDEGVNKICLIDYNISLILDESAGAIGVSDGYSPPEQYGTTENINPDNSDESTVLDDSYPILSENDATLIDTEFTSMTKSNDEKPTLIDLPNNTEPKNRGYSNSKRRVDARSDIYSIGATMYHLAAGHKPNISSEYITPVREVNDRISEGLAAIIDKAMQKNPEKRFQSAEQMLKALVNLRRYDKRYKSLILRQEIAVILVISAMAASVITAVYGYNKLDTEQAEQYDGYVAMIDNADINSSAEKYMNAVELMPQRAEAYEKMAYQYFYSGDYVSAEEYISGILDKNLYDENGSKYVPDKLFYLLGRCFLETKEYDKSADAFKNAVEINDSENNYYRDYAVSLARGGKTSEAEKMLQKAEERNISGENVSFVKGEIEYALGNYTESISEFKACIASADDTDIIYRAYLIGANAYSAASKAKASAERIDFLNEAIAVLPLEKTMPFYQMLAQAYIDEAQLGNDMVCYENAIKIYEKLNSLGWSSAESEYSLIRLYRIVGNIELAKNTAAKAIENNPDDYVSYKLMAFIETDIQDKKVISLRNYNEFGRYYNTARKLCTDNEDFEMQLLDEAYDKLVKEGML